MADRLERVRNNHGSLLRAGRRVRNARPVVRTIAALRRAGGVILRYHSVSDDSGWAGDYIQKSLVVPPDAFERQVAALVKYHRVVPVETLAAAVRRGKRVDSGAVAITFDDGYEDNYRVALPILRKYGATAMFYVSTAAVGDADILWTVKLRHALKKCPEESLTLSFLGTRPLDLSSDSAREAAIKMVTGLVKRCKRDEIDRILTEVDQRVTSNGNPVSRRIMMNWDEVAELSESGMGIGAHTVSHFNLPSLDTSHVAQEVVASKREIEERLGRPVRHFAYPNGRTDHHCDARVAKIVALAGFESAATSLAGPVSSRYAEYCLPRLGVAPRHSDVERLLADVQYSKFKYQNLRTVEEITRVLPVGGDADAGNHLQSHDGGDV